MKRVATILAAIGLVTGACGGDDAEPAAEPAAAAEQDAAEPSENEEQPAPTADESSTAADSDSGDGAIGESDGDTEQSDDALTNETDEPDETDDTDDTDDTDETDESDATEGEADDADSDDDGSAGGAIVVRSIDDIPAECREQMADFLRQIEPVVSPVDWDTATFAEFETIAAEFEAISTEFDEQFSDSLCNDLEFASEDAEFDMMIDFARVEAPGVVSFFTFLGSLGAVGGPDDDTGASADDGAPGGASAFTDCAGAIEFVELLMAEYDSFLDVPAAQLVAFAGIGQIYPTCTPEQLAFFDSPEVIEFLG